LAKKNSSSTWNCPSTPYHPPQAFATVALAGWGMQLEVIVAPYLKDGTLVELVPGTPLDVPLYWQQARAASGVLEGLSRVVLGAARGALLAV
jgi:LysR family transcriptional regulator (chromosome initiation inhibitor)